MKNILVLTAQKTCLFILLVLSVSLNSACDAGSQPAKPTEPATVKTETSQPTVPTPVADAATILHKPEVPILCYHQIRDFKPTDSHTAKDYIVPVANFREQMKLLADSGYHAILPDQLYDYLTTGKTLPSKPVMITFDDTRLDHYIIALPELKKYGYKGVFFIMTVSLGRPGYMTKEQVKEISDQGNVIGSHTWDHHNVKKYTGNDWVVQVEKPSRQLAEITGKPIEYFAYPFGLWNKEAIQGLKQYKFKAVFQLSDRRDENGPLYSIRRVIIPGEYSATTMLRVMKNSFR